MRSTPRSNWIGACALVLLTGGSTSAHRLDEYLQAARLAIGPDRVQIELTLTPGVAVAKRVLAEIDLDRTGSISPGEARAYCGRLLNSIAVDIDGMPLVLDVSDSTFPDIDGLLNGEGAVRIQATAALPPLSAGTHRLRYRNSYRADIGAYLVNALVPASERVVVASQHRDVDQRDVTIEYTLRADRTARVRAGLSLGLAGALVLLTAMWRRSRHQGATGQEEM